MIYLDHAATTPLDPRVLDEMLPYLRDDFGNPSSLYHLGRRARKAVEDARESIAASLGATPAEIVFTSGGSESDSYAISGLAAAAGDKRHLLFSPIEHPAVLRAVERLAGDGSETEPLPVDRDGRVAPEAVVERLRDDTALVAVMAANNEIGTIQPIAEIGAICRARRVPLHCDAVQALGQMPLDVGELNVATLAGTAHKIYGPKGVGFCYVRRGVRPRPLIWGGSQERSRRAGTENVAGIVGLAAALRYRDAERDEYVAHCTGLRDRLIDALTAIDGAVLNGPREGRLANNVNVSFERISGESLMILLDGESIAVSTGSACSSGATDPSHVLLAISEDRDLAFGSLRLTVGRGTTAEEVATTSEAVRDGVARLRAYLPVSATGTESR